MIDPAKDAERLAAIRATSTYRERELLAVIDRLTQERDEAREQAAHLRRGFESVEKQCRERGRELREARRKLEAEYNRDFDNPPAPQPTTDDVERARESKENTHQRYYGAFHDWFMSENSSCDFWSECDAPEALATIAVEIHDAALTAARREEHQSALKVIGRLQELVVNVRHWVAHGCSETAIKALDEAMAAFDSERPR